MIPPAIVPTLSDAQAVAQAPPAAAAEPDLEFWARQFSEHALFLSLGIVADPALSREAARQHGLWEAYRKMETSRERMIELATLLASLKEEVLSRLEGGEWLGWLYPAFVRHILQELLWVMSRLERKTPPAYGMADVQTWLRFMAEHAAFAAHLLDPTEVRLIREARALLGALQGLVSCKSSLPSLKDLSTRAGNQLDQYLVTSGIGTPKVKSVIHPVLAAHVVREGRMFLEVLGATRAGA